MVSGSSEQTRVDALAKANRAGNRPAMPSSAGRRYQDWSSPLMVGSVVGSLAEEFRRYG